MSNIEYGRKEEKTQFMRKKIKNADSDLKSFCLSIAKKVSQPYAKGESIVCKSELKFWKLPENQSDFIFVQFFFFENSHPGSSNRK